MGGLAALGATFKYVYPSILVSIYEKRLEDREKWLRLLKTKSIEGQSFFHLNASLSSLEFIWKLQTHGKYAQKHDPDKIYETRKELVGMLNKLLSIHSGRVFTELEKVNFATEEISAECSDLKKNLSQLSDSVLFSNLHSCQDAESILKNLERLNKNLSNMTLLINKIPYQAIHAFNQDASLFTLTPLKAKDGDPLEIYIREYYEKISEISEKKFRKK